VITVCFGNLNLFFFSNEFFKSSRQTDFVYIAGCHSVGPRHLRPVLVCDNARAVAQSYRLELFNFGFCTATYCYVLLRTSAGHIHKLQLVQDSNDVITSAIKKLRFCRIHLLGYCNNKNGQTIINL